MYDSNEAVCNVYDDILSHKLKKLTRCGECNGAEKVVPGGVVCSNGLVS